MKLSLESDRHIYRIQSYAVDTVVIQNPLQSLPDDFQMLERDEQRQHLFTEARDSFVIAPQQLILDWGPGVMDPLMTSDLEKLLELEPEVVLLGTGQALRFPPADIVAPLARAGVGLEVMDNGAACRTYNILAGEGRRVVAAMMLHH